MTAEASNDIEILLEAPAPNGFQKDENMETECDSGYTSPKLDKDREAVFRPPLKDVRKQLDAGSSTGGTITMSPRGMAEYKRITAMASL